MDQAKRLEYLEKKRAYKKQYILTHNNICICPCSNNKPFKEINKQIHWGSKKHQKYISEFGDPEIGILSVDSKGT